MLSLTTLRVPKYSPEEDRITIEIQSLAHGCELRPPTNGLTIPNSAGR